MSDDGGAPSHNVGQLLGLAGLFVAPTTLITGLCYYLGFVSTRHHLQHFGVDPQAIGFSTTDYVLKAVVVYAIPVLCTLLIGVAFIAAGAGVRSAVEAERWAPPSRVIAWALLSTAAAIVAIATASLWFDIVWIAWPSTLVTAASSTTGALLLLLGHQMRTRAGNGSRAHVRVVVAAARIASAIGAFSVLYVLTWPILRFLWGPHGSPFMTFTLFLAGPAIFAASYWILRITRPQADRPRAFTAFEPIGLGLAVAIMVVALFGLTGQYAIKAGDLEGEKTEDELWSRDIGVVLETDIDRLLPDDVIARTPITDPAGRTNQRYECLRVLEIRAGNWVLVPAKWTREEGYALIVTPDDSHRITTTVHAGRAAQTGSGDNVTRFWDCPEVVPTYTPSQTEASLLSVGETATLLKTSGLGAESASGTPNMLGQNASGASPPCSREASAQQSSPLVPDYRNSAAIALYEQALHGNALGARLWVSEGVTVFPNAGEAYNFVVATSQLWGNCADSVVSVARHNTIEPRWLGQLEIDGAEGILWIEDSAVDAPGPADCSQAIVAKANIVIDVDVCGGSDRTAAPLLARTIRDKLPT